VTFVQTIVMSYLFYIGDYILSGGAILLIFLFWGSMFIGLPITNSLTKRMDPVRVNQIFLYVIGASLILLTFAPGALIYLCVAVAGIGMAGPLVLNNVLYGEVADEDELKTGCRREGAFFGVNALIAKPAESVAVFLPAIILAATGFVPRGSVGGDLVRQTSTALLGIRINAGLLPGAVALATALLLQAFPLRGHYLTSVRGKVLSLHEQKQDKLAQVEGRCDTDKAHTGTS
jgi:GPH family glycoside/pentoside/hexuronide:cation symporter